MQPSSTQLCISVTQVNRYIKSLLDENKLLKSVYIRGEISNFTNHYKSGHFYFTLKDENCAVKCVMFKSSNRLLDFMPEDGQAVIVQGRISAYEKTGEYQVYVNDMAPDGLGELHIKFEALKKELSALGYFDPERKRPIPRFPETIGVITSETGAALQDIINTLSRRYPIGKLILFPTFVQGRYAAAHIVKSLDLANRLHSCDVLILARGGGSIEDLWSFNTREVADAILRSDIPVISAIGHETDFTISDFTADLRAPTPTAAAELAAAGRDELALTLQGYESRMKNTMERKLHTAETLLRSYENHAALRSPKYHLERKAERFSALQDELLGSMSRILSEKENSLADSASLLSALSPLNILARGYAIPLKDGAAVKNVSDLREGDRFTVRFSKGEADVLTEKIRPAVKKRAKNTVSSESDEKGNQ